MLLVWRAVPYFSSYRIPVAVKYHFCYVQITTEYNLRTLPWIPYASYQIHKIAGERGFHATDFKENC